MGRCYIELETYYNKENKMQPDMRLNVNLKDCKNVFCENCDHTFFNTTFIIKEVSALASPTGEEMILPVQLFSCASCNHVNESFFEHVGAPDGSEKSDDKEELFMNLQK